MQVQSDGLNNKFILKNDRVIELTHQELAELEQLIKVLRTLNDHISYNDFTVQTK